MKRPATAFATLVLALGLAVPGAAHASSPACSGDGTLCLAYAVGLFQPGSPGTAETRTQRPVDLTLDLANNSPNHATDSNTWVDRVSVEPLGGSLTSAPLITRSESLPDGLLVAGSATDCGASLSCTAGYGTAFASGGTCSGFTCTFQFGIQRIYNVKATTHHNEFTIQISGCATNFGGSICSATTFNDISQNVTFDTTTSGGPTHFTFAFDPTTIGFGITRASIDSLHVAIDGQAAQTLAGPADKTYDWFRLPTACGTASGSATATDYGGQSATASADISVTGCLDVTGTASTHQVRYGGHATLSGGLAPTDADSPSPGNAPLLLRTCPVGRACSTVPATAGATGDWSFTVTPQRTTTYSVQYADPDVTNWVPVGRSFTVRVLPVVSRRASATQVPHGGRVTLTGAVTPNDAGAKAALQRYVSGTWKTLSTTTVTSRSAYALSAKLAGSRGTRATLRVRVAGNTRFVTATSPTVTISLT